MTQILIIDMGSQYTLVISRILREIGVRSTILSPEKASNWLSTHTPKGIILSGGDKSVLDDDAPPVPEGLFSTFDIPILGICYGMQLMAHHFGGEVVKAKVKNYGETQIQCGIIQDGLFGTGEIPVNMFTTVWSSHGDLVTSVPEGFTVTSSFAASRPATAAFSNVEKRLWGIQFHPEVTQTRIGKNLLINFVIGICECEEDWCRHDIVNQIQMKAMEEVGDNNCIIGFSGGVDSTTLADILTRVLSPVVQGICIDHGGLRENEIEEIKDNAKHVDLPLTIVNAQHRFQVALEGIVDAEEKRQAFKKVYQQIFQEHITSINAKFIIQGSIAADVIESGATGEAALIKSHHNVGHKWDGVEEIALFTDLFKYEVREIAQYLHLPNSIVHRQPFPGPGLFLRVLGASATTERLTIVREATTIVTKILQDANIYDDISQLVVALMCVNTVGIKGDARTYGPSIVVRAIETQDFMTVRGYQIPDHIRRVISTQVAKHPSISRVWFDEMDKPPATVEFE